MLGVSLAVYTKPPLQRFHSIIIGSVCERPERYAERASTPAIRFSLPRALPSESTYTRSDELETSKIILEAQTEGFPTASITSDSSPNDLPYGTPSMLRMIMGAI